MIDSAFQVWLWLPKRWKLVQLIAYQMRFWVRFCRFSLLNLLLPHQLSQSSGEICCLPLVHNLDFDESMVLYPNRTSATSGGGGFLDFVDKTLVLLGDSPIKKFNLKWNSEIDHSRYNHLIRNVLERGPLELHLSSPSDQYIEPEFLFSKTLVKLTLSHGFYAQDRLPPHGVLFPALKTLSLFQVCCVDL